MNWPDKVLKGNVKPGFTIDLALFFGSALHASHRHRMAKSSSRMCIDRDLCDLSVRKLVGALHFEGGGSGLDLESTCQGRRNQCRSDFLMDLDDALAEKVFD